MRKRTIITEKLKVDIYELYKKQNISIVKLSKKINIHRSTITKILKSFDKNIVTRFWSQEIIDKVIKLYVYQQLTPTQISHKLSISKDTISDMLRRNKISRRGKKLSVETEQKIIDLYTNGSMTLSAICQKYNHDSRTVTNILKKYNILKRKEQKVNKNNKNTINEQIISLRKKDVSITEIGTIVSVSYSYVYSVCKQNNLLDEKVDVISKLDFNKINNMYHLDTPLIDIATHFNCTPFFIKKVLETFGITQEHLNENVLQRQHEKEKIIVDLYVKQYCSIPTITKKLNLSNAQVSRILNKQGIKKRPIGQVRKQLSDTEYEKYLNTLSEFKKYRRCVQNTTLRQNLKILYHYEKQGAGKGKYQLDHMYSVYAGFMNNIQPEIIGHISNLKFIPQQENRYKHINCSISIPELNYRIQNNIIN